MVEQLPLGPQYREPVSQSAVAAKRKGAETVQSAPHSGERRRRRGAKYRAAVNGSNRHLCTEEKLSP